MVDLRLSDSQFAWLLQYYVGITSASFLMFSLTVGYLFLYKYRKCDYDLFIGAIIIIYEAIFTARLSYSIISLVKHSFVLSFDIYQCIAPDFF